MSRVFPGTLTRFLLLVLVTVWLVYRGPLPSTAISPLPSLASLSAQTMAAQADQYLSDLATKAGFSGAVLMARNGDYFAQRWLWRGRSRSPPFEY